METMKTERKKEEVLERLAKGILPNSEEKALAGLSESQAASMWMTGAEIVAKEDREASSKHFRGSGEGAAWYLDYDPQNASEEAVLDQTGEALDLVEGLYDSILSSGQKRSDGTVGISDEDCLLKISRFGNSEGILVKQGSYDRDIKVIITGHTGPRSFDLSDGTVDFEPGCEAFRFRLAYQSGMPSKEQLVQDVAAYLKISRERKGKSFFDEGGLGPESRNVPFHQLMGYNEWSPLFEKWVTLSGKVVS